MEESSPRTRPLLGEAVVGPQVDRDLVFARVEQRLLGHALDPVRVGRFVVLERVGHGGMGVVYAAHDPELERKVAIKIVDRDLGADPSSEARQELLQEARAAAALTHPNVVSVYEVGLQGGAVFLAMEFVDGPTLRVWLRERARGWPEVVEMFVAAGRGLSAAHRAGVVHRDFKPDNVLIGSDDRPRVADFGLARSIMQGRTSEDEGSPGEVTSTAVAGTPRYMAPEQHMGKGIGPASDQFAFCVALYEALFEHHPFEAGSRSAMVDRVMNERPDPPGAAAAGVPLRVQRLVLKGLAVLPERRHPSIDALLEGLEGVLRRRRWVVGGIGAVGLAGVAALAGYGFAPDGSVDLCDDAAAPIVARWGPGTRAELEEAFVATGRAGARSTATLLADKLDRYAAQWVAVRERSCRAVYEQGRRSERFLELSYACLDQRLEGMSLLVDLMFSADAPMVGRATRAADDLAPVARCEDRRELLAEYDNMFSDRSEYTRPGAFERWSELSTRYEQAEVLRGIGRVEEARGRADALVDAAQAENLRGIEASARGLRARLWLQRFELPEAETEARRALTLSLVADRRDWAIESLLMLSQVRRKRRESIDQARLLLDMAEGLAHREPRPATLTLSVAMEKARIDRLERRYEAAIDGLRGALTEAEALGPDHTKVLSARNDLGANLASLGRWAEAQQIFTELLPRRIAASGPEHRSVGTLLINLGVASQEQRQWAEAGDYYTRAMALYEGRSKTRGEQVRFRLGMLRQKQGRVDEARVLLSQVLQMRSDRQGSDHADLAEVLDALAETERELGQLRAAREHARRSVELIERAHGPDYLDLWGPLTMLGKIALDQGRSRDAVAKLRRARALVYAVEVDAVIRIEVDFTLARATVDAPGGREQAFELAREALRRCAEAGARADPMRAEIEQWLREYA